MAISGDDIAQALALTCYGATLDAAGARRIADEIGDDPAALRAVAERMRGDAVRFAVGQAVADHSQHGEFPLLLRALVQAGSGPGVVVDAGAKGRIGSNSYDLVRSFGWRGILIEALPARAAQLARDFDGSDHRVFNCAVGLEPGRAPLYLGENGFIASLMAPVACYFGGTGDFIDVDVRRLRDILVEADVPADFDLLSIDIEGLDVAVLNQLIAESDYRPRYVIVEAHHEFAKAFDALGFAPEVLASYAEIARTLPNLILKRRA